jgi:beta-glucosidase
MRPLLPLLIATACIAPAVLANKVIPVLSGGEYATLKSGGKPLVEAYGREMVVTFPGLPTGDYTVEVEAREIFFDAAGKRLMDIRCGETVIAAGWDIFKTVGKKDAPATVSGKVAHAGDSLRGALAVAFVGKTDNAKFDVVRVKDASGKTVAEARAAVLRDGDNAVFATIPEVTGPEIWKDTSKSVEVRADDLIRRLSVKEKISQIMMGAPGVPRLGIPSYDWWNECLHGVARAGTATVFPQAITAAATWDDELWRKAADAMSDEARAKHHEYSRKHGGASARYYGLDMWSPNVNIFRDPRWGRGHETYGEDPYLSGRFGVAFTRGLQGDDAKYIKVVATPKHYAVHSGPEPLRHRFDIDVSEQDLRETYLPAFEACFREGKAFSVMGAYNRFRGESASSSKYLLDDILRKEWGFSGYSVSDVDSVADIYTHHKIKKTAAEAAAHALKNGMDLNSGGTYNALPEALKKGLCTTADIDRALKRCLIARFRLGMFDPAGAVPYAKIPLSVVDSPEHDNLALEVARKAMVLLKNDAKTLPFPKTGTVAVIGPLADDGRTERGQNASILTANYNGDPSHPVSILMGVQALLKDKATVVYAKGCNLKNGNVDMEREALAVAEKADRIVAVMGLSPKIEGEEGEGGERSEIGLFPHQEALLKKLKATGKPVVLVLTGGSAIAANWAKAEIPAILDAWYPGQRGGDAVAETLFGDSNPGGRLPVTFYKTEKDLPDFAHYDMREKNGRTYRYFTGEPLWAFGHGLSYTTFAYGEPSVVTLADGVRTVAVTVKNTGDRAGDEVVQLYVSREGAPADAGLPLRSLRAFSRVPLVAGETKTVSFTLHPHQLAFVNKKGVRTVESGEYTIGIGGSQTPSGTITLTVGATIENPPYEHTTPVVR